MDKWNVSLNRIGKITDFIIMFQCDLIPTAQNRPIVYVWQVLTDHSRQDIVQVGNNLFPVVAEYINFDVQFFQQADFKPDIGI